MEWSGLMCVVVWHIFLHSLDHLHSVLIDHHMSVTGKCCSVALFCHHKYHQVVSFGDKCMYILYAWSVKKNGGKQSSMFFPARLTTWALKILVFNNIGLSRHAHWPQPDPTHIPSWWWCHRSFIAIPTDWYCIAGVHVYSKVLYSSSGECSRDS